jgi:hypothetical protein
MKAPIAQSGGLQLCLLASFFTDNPWYPAMDLLFGLSLERFAELLGSDLWVHGLPNEINGYTLDTKLSNLYGKVYVNTNL